MIRPCDMMAVVMAASSAMETVFHGVSSHLPMVALLLAKRLHAPNAVHLNIAGGVDPQMARQDSISSAGSSLWAHAGAAFTLSDVFDLSMRGGLDVAFLSGVQFDSKGGVNASLIGDWQQPRVRLPGGAGSAVLIPTARRAILWRTRHDRRTLVNQLDFLTARGNVSDLITPLCHFTMYEGEMLLKSIHPYPLRPSQSARASQSATSRWKAPRPPRLRSARGRLIQVTCGTSVPLTVRTEPFIFKGGRAAHARPPGIRCGKFTWRQEPPTAGKRPAIHIMEEL